MKKTIYIIFIILIISVIAYYLISPAFKTLEVDEDSPLIIKDSMLTMTEEQKANFDKAVESTKDEVMEKSESMDLSAKLISKASLKPRAHDVQGQALLISQNNNTILRFENFETINGPNLHIYLSSDLSDDDFIDLGKIKATKGNVNYNIPENIDTEKYNKVLVWCVPFKVLFSYADLG